MEIIYPRRGVQVFIPRDLGGVMRGVVFEVAHREPGVEVFWHIDDRYVGSTRYRHQLEVNVPPGRHVLYLVDEYGNTLSRSFTVVENS